MPDSPREGGVLFFGDSLPHHYGWDQSFLDQHGGHFGASFGNFEAHTLPNTAHPWIQPGRIRGYGLKTFTEPWRVFNETRDVIWEVASWGVLGPTWRAAKYGAREFTRLIMNNPTVRNFIYNRVKQPVQSFLVSTGIYAFLLAGGKAAKSKTAARSGKAYVTRGYGTPKPKQTILGNQIKTLAAGYKYDKAKFWGDLWQRILERLGKQGLENLAQSILDWLRDRGDNNMAWFYRRRRTYGRRSYGYRRNTYRRNYGFRRSYRRYPSSRRFGYRRSW